MAVSSALRVWLAVTVFPRLVVLRRIVAGCDAPGAVCGSTDTYRRPSLNSSRRCDFCRRPRPTARKQPPLPGRRGLGGPPSALEPGGQAEAGEHLVVPEHGVPADAGGGDG